MEMNKQTHFPVVWMKVNSTLCVCFINLIDGLIRVIYWPRSYEMHGPQRM